MDNAVYEEYLCTEYDWYYSHILPQEIEHLVIVCSPEAANSKSNDISFNKQMKHLINSILQASFHVVEYG